MSTQSTIYDAAAQLERTMLSWNRTMLVFAANGVLLIKVGYASGAWCVIVGASVLVAALVAWLIASRAYRQLRCRPHNVIHWLRKRLQVATWVALAVGLADVVAILTYR